jgi:general secretion pathway protein G
MRDRLGDPETLLERWRPVLVLVELCFLAAELTPESTSCPRGDPAARVRQDLWAFECAMDAYAREHAGRFPTVLNDLVRPDDLGRRFLESARVPRDPWGEPYVFVPAPVGSRPHVMTLGRDREAGGEGIEADVDSRDLFADR